jgi:hypothetical protein
MNPTPSKVIRKEVYLRTKGPYGLSKDHGPKMSQPHFGLSVKVKPTLPKVGSWSPSGLSKIQSSIVGVKYPRM